MIEDRDRSAPANLRDLGGIPAAGGVVRCGVAIRADDLSLTRRADAEALVAGGLAAVIDLRTSAEVHNTGRGVLAELPVTYHHLSLMSALGARGPAARVDPRDPVAMGGLYADIYTMSAGRIVTALAILALTPGATAFHCSAGRDRTGVLAAAFLLTLGASDDDIVADYALTGANSAAIRRRLRPVLRRLLPQHGIRSSVTAAAEEEQFSTVAMETMLALLRERHGDPRRPLREAGLSDGLVDTLCRRAVDAT